MSDPTNHYIDGAVTEDFGLLLMELAGAWDTQLSELRVRVYAKALSGVPLSVLSRVFSQMVREEDRFPSIKTILSHVAPRTEDAALLAWSGLERAADEVGAWSDLRVEDGASAAALTTVFGSWAMFCELPDGPARALKRQEFLAAYRMHRRQGTHVPVVLPGLLSSSQSQHSWAGVLAEDGKVSRVRHIEAHREAPKRIADSSRRGRR